MKQLRTLLNRFDLLRDLALCAAATVVACGFAAVLHSSSHPDEKRAVHNAFISHNLATVNVEEDQDKGVIRLSGIVGSHGLRDLAHQLAQQAAPGYSIDDQIQVNQTGLM